MNRGMASAAVLLFLLFVICDANATPLGLELSYPDVTSGLLTVSYDQTPVPMLRVTGLALTLEIDGVGAPDYIIADGWFDLDARVYGTTFYGGTLVISGTVPTLYTSGTLLSVTLTEMGFSDEGGEVFEFAGDATGGDLAALPGMSRIGVIIDTFDSGFGGLFTGSFANSGFGVSDTAAVPEPSSILLLLLGGYGTLLARRKSAR